MRWFLVTGLVLLPLLMGLPLKDTEPKSDSPLIGSVNAVQISSSMVCDCKNIHGCYSNFEFQGEDDDFVGGLGVDEPVEAKEVSKPMAALLQEDEGQICDECTLHKTVVPDGDAQTKVLMFLSSHLKF